MQRHFHPHGDAVCQQLLLHPPGGVVGGDRLHIDVAVECGASAQLTSPGATKWYRSDGPLATQHISVRVEADACLEWLPQPAIAFSGARVQTSTHIALDPTARFIGWELTSLGRSAGPEALHPFVDGRLDASLHVATNGRAVIDERLRFDAGDPWTLSPVGLAGATAFGTFIATLPAAQHAIVDVLRALSVPAGLRVGLTVVSGLLIARCLGPSADDAFWWFVALWQRARPALLGAPHPIPRIWHT